MLPSTVTSQIQRIDHLSSQLSKASGDVDITLQTVFANHMVLAASGLIEQTVIGVLGEYGRRNGNLPLSRYLEKTAGRLNSLNCEKIENLLSHFDRSWWPRIVDETTLQDREAVNSLKTIRDQIAHGKPNGTGMVTVSGYYTGAKRFSRAFGGVLLGDLQ